MCRELPIIQTNIHMAPVGFETTSSSLAGRRFTTGPRCPQIKQCYVKLFQSERMLSLHSRLSLTSSFALFYKANNMILRTAVEEFRRTFRPAQPDSGTRPHFVTSNLEHDAVKLVLEEMKARKVAGTWTCVFY